MIICTGALPWIVLDLLQWKTQCLGFVYFTYTYRLLFIALFDNFNLIISICHCLCPSFYPYLNNRWSRRSSMSCRIVIIIILILVSEFRAAVDWHVINDGTIWFAWLMTRLLAHGRKCLLAFVIVYVHHFIHIWIIDEVNYSTI
jgi:hypothetical protein